MINELLKAAMAQAAITPDRLAELVEVDPKSISRWLAGTTPYPRSRARVAAALGVSAHELWPDADQPPIPPPTTSDDNPADDLDDVFAGSDDPAAPDPREVLEAASETIDLLGVSLGELLADPEVRALLRANAERGVAIRLLIADPASAYLLAIEHEREQRTDLTQRPILTWEVQLGLGYLQPLLESSSVQARTYVAAPANTILRGDERMLVGLHLYGAPDQLQPIVALTRRTEHRLFDRFAHHFELIWQHASQPLSSDAERYPDPDQHPDRYQPTDPAQQTPRYIAFGARDRLDAEQVSPTASTAPKSSWPRRR